MSGPHQPPRPRNAPRPPRPAAPARSVRPLNERELDELQALLDRVPAPLEALDVSMLDGYLCGVLLQPRHIAVARWLPHVIDVDGRAPPPSFDAARLGSLVLRRHAELDDAIQRRQWFDPWVFELSNDDETVGEDDEDDEGSGAVDAVYPWVAGFVTALELFPDLMAQDAKALTEPLALVYRHLAPDDLEDADELLAEIESLEPPEDLADAVEGLVRATLLLADISRPVVTAAAAPMRPRRAPSNR
ncbi:MAG TPA: YecA family protein [Burkholderiaceae bacterium]|nr:YecA family protein [Burkholderiaceae bacterium]